MGGIGAREESAWAHVHSSRERRHSGIVALMEVFVIPIGRDRNELYCEPASDAPPDEPLGTGLIARLKHRMAKAIHDAGHRHGVEPPAGSTSVLARLQERMFAWAAERIAEQRLLWNLRGQSQVTVAYPQDMTFDQVESLVRHELRKDYDRHLRWTAIDAFLFLVTFVALGPLFILIPGVANLPAIYFGFRTILHFFSMRGAAQGLHRVQWIGRPCPPLDELRDVATLEPAARDQRVHDIASRLRLQHLSTFFERVAV
jgi:hypothetical protein